jgi:hypothetical protein
MHMFIKLQQVLSLRIGPAAQHIDSLVSKFELA